MVIVGTGGIWTTVEQTILLGSWNTETRFKNDKS
jgi:hypothetical protein